jgi:NADH-quinone oxidoreductase subunit M
MDFPILSVTIFIPLIAGLIILLFGRNKPGLIRPLALVASALVLLFTIILWASYSIEDAGYQFTEYISWLPQLGIAYHLGVD